MTYDPTRMCLTKKLYMWHWQAQRAARRMRPKQRAYHCPHCFCYHLTTQGKK